ncbi:MAG: carbon-nitrogen hydrolase family protein [Planctomycetota bacterium]
MNSESSAIGRPVRVVSIGFRVGKSLSEVADLVNREGEQGADLIALPEVFMDQRDDALDRLDGKTVRTMSALAARHRTYVVCPIDRWDGKRRFNSNVLLDRKGEIACIYDKVFPYWSEFDHKPPVSPGEDAPVHAADFGRVGMATCFDANFPEVWKRLANQDAELVIFSSAYSAGATLLAPALTHHYYIVSSTRCPDCVVCDITGEPILYRKDDNVNITRVTLDLDRGIYHQNFNTEKRDRLLKEHPEDVMMETWFRREEWFVLKAKRPGVSARGLARQYGMEELRDYQNRSRRQIDRMRGWSFRARTIEGEP